MIYYVDDHLGSSHLVTDSLGNVLKEESRYPYGLERSSQPEPQSESAVAVDYVYTGKEYDVETGLIYFGGRYYAPELGRWITPDPLFLEKELGKIIETPKELNLYAYVQGNPVGSVDSDGYITIGYSVDVTGGNVVGSRVGYMAVADDKGNIGLLVHGGGGAYVGKGGGLNACISITDADTIYDLEGASIAIGGSATKVIGVSAEYIEGANGVKGVELGVSVTPMITSSLEAHAIVENNKIIKAFNPAKRIIDYLDNYVDRTLTNIMEESSSSWRGSDDNGSQNYSEQVE